MPFFHSSILFVSIFLLTGCQIGTQVQGHDLDVEEHQILFFSDDEYVDLEDAYYDAMLELKREYPEHMQNIKIMPVQKHDDLVEKYKIDSFPCLIYLEKSEMKVKIEGSQPKHIVNDELRKVFSLK